MGAGKAAQNTEAEVPKANEPASQTSSLSKKVRGDIWGFPIFLTHTQASPHLGA